MGTIISGNWLSYNAPRIKAYNNIENDTYSNTISDDIRMNRPYSKSILTQKEVIKYGNMNMESKSIYEFVAQGTMTPKTSPIGAVSTAQEKPWRLIVDIANNKVFHWGHGF